MRLPPYGLCEHGDPGSSPAGLREVSSLVVISQPAPIAPHLSGPAEDSSSDSVSSEERRSRGREEGLGPKPSGPASRAGSLSHTGLSFFLGGRGGRPSLSSRPPNRHHPQTQSDPIASLLPAPASHIHFLLIHQPPAKHLSCPTLTVALCSLAWPGLLFPYLSQCTAPPYWDTTPKPNLSPWCPGG